MAATSVSVEREQFLEKLARAREAALLLDYDGTLAPFCVQRHRATPYPGVSTLLRKIMDTATKPEDVLQIFNQLKQVNEQIEVLKGQIKYYDESAAMSEISVSIQAKETVEPISVAGWSPKGIARDALQALVDVYQGIASAVIWIVITILPVVIPLGLVVFGIVRLVKWLGRKNKVVKIEKTGVESK